MVAIIGVTEVLEGWFGRNDAWTLLMRAAAETYRNVLRDSTTPEQVEQAGQVVLQRVDRGSDVRGWLRTAERRQPR
jgi:hypothetical protein